MAKTAEDFIPEAEAMTFTGYSRTSLYNFRISGRLRWTASATGRKIRYHKKDLEKLIGLTN
jgi:predicted DNA-binding transcriptional regulator AlpA